jgi:hypothetical protein
MAAKQTKSKQHERKVTHNNFFKFKKNGLVEGYGATK